MKTYKAITAEAVEYGIRIEQIGNSYVGFVAADHTPAWMQKIGGSQPYWCGFTSNPEVTGTKRGTKGEVANWCLDWAANGF